MIYLTVSAKFTSGYALRLYELLAMRLQSGEMSWAVNIDTLRVQLGATEVSYDHIASLYRKVLAPALAEINDYAPFQVKVERQTAAAGRGANKVTGLVFYITRDPERVIEVTTMTTAPRVQFCFDLRKDQAGVEGTGDAVSDAAAAEQANRVLRRRDALEAKYAGWPLDSLAQEWGRDLLASGKDTKRPFEAFEMWLSYRFGHLFCNGEPQPVSSPDQVTSWIITPELDRAGRSALAMRPAQRRQWAHAARHQDETVDVERMDPIEFHRWVPLIARDLLLRGLGRHPFMPLAVDGHVTGTRWERRGSEFRTGLTLPRVVAFQSAVAYARKVCESIKMCGVLRPRRLVSGCHLRPWPGTIFWKVSGRVPSRVWVRVCRSKWAPAFDHCICCFLAKRVPTTRLTADLVKAVEIGSRVAPAFAIVGDRGRVVVDVGDRQGLPPLWRTAAGRGSRWSGRRHPRQVPGRGSGPRRCCHARAAT